MSTLFKPVRNLLLGATFSVLLAAPVLADDAEIFVSDPTAVGARPNILFVIDTSGSMDTRDGGAGTPTRLEIVRDAAIGLVNSLQDVNIGLMRYSSNAQGGMVIEAVDNIANNRATILNRLNTFTPLFGNGNTPLSETYYEAALYLKGAAVKYGDTSSPEPSIPASRVGGNTWTYKSPIEFQCQKSYIVYLTDGEPTADNDANTDIQALIGHACDAPSVGGFPVNNGRCTDDLAEYLSSTATDLSSSQLGNQNALTYMIGYGATITAGAGYLNAVAAAGGTGAAYMAADAASLTTKLQQIFMDIDNRSQTFTTPSISVNAFNRTQTGTDLFFSLFRVEDTERWSGNLKKYKLQGSTIVDVNDAPAVTNGFFSGGATSFWSPVQDGSDVKAGGAVSQLDVPANRKLYTHTGGTKDLNDPSNALLDSNGALTNTALAVPDNPTRQKAINWARGYPAGNAANPPEKYMGDPVHGTPAVVTYGGTAADPDTVVYVPTNDGFLHAIVGKSATSAPGTGGGGQELWAFIPPELLPRLQKLAAITAAPHKYGLDGDVQVLQHDANRDGVVNGSDFVWLFFGMRMGGNHYYALDVTDRNNPQLLWNIGPTELPQVGQTWSPPMIARVAVSAPANTEPNKYVLIFGGGYDPGQELPPYSVDAVGNRIFMVDAQTGGLLWYAGNNGGANLVLDDPGKSMDNSIPSRITVIDTNSDQLADRMYVGDMGGRIWRFDIFNGQPASSLVTGGILADLGARGAVGNTVDNRRFYNAPDVALIQRRGAAPYYNLAIGSGYRGRPLNTGTQERFYSIRDKSPYSQLDATAYSSLTPILDGDLVDLIDPGTTVVPPVSAGWKYNLSQQPGRAGEKVLAEATTVNGVILFPTFQPGSTTAQSAGNPCYPVNTNRVYAMSVDSGRPAIDFNDDGINDISTDLSQTGIVGQINVSILQPTTPPPNVDTDGDGIPDDIDTDDDNDGILDTAEDCSDTICSAGVEVLNKCVCAGSHVRTFWRRNAD